MKKNSILYISAEGHSGTTLLDVILGNQQNAFSSGELVFFAQKGIKNKEYCSCGNPVPDCQIWSDIIREWNKKRILDLDEYIQIQSRLTSLKNIFSSYLALKKPSAKLSHFISDTNTLYATIFKITGSTTIIDSSKAPGRLLLLKKLDFDIKAIHLTRRFGDVLNSYKKRASKNLEEGVEHDIVPLSSTYVFPSWLTKNLITYFFSAGLSYKKIKYENLVMNPEKELYELINRNDEKIIDKLKHRGPFSLKHLVAGNKFRMKEHIYIADKPMNTSYNRLKGMDRALAKFVDFFY